MRELKFSLETIEETGRKIKQITDSMKTIPLDVLVEMRDIIVAEIKRTKKLKNEPDYNSNQAKLKKELECYNVLIQLKKSLNFDDYLKALIQEGKF